MKTGFYPKLVLDGIRKNRKLYIPYILTCAGMTAVYYIITSLQYTEVLDHFSGADTLRSVLGFGSWVIAVFSLIFLFYTNSFLIRRRKKEFGLYHVLGMGKGNLGILLCWESLIIAVIALISGLFFGILLSKFSELIFANIVHGDIVYHFSVSGRAAVRAAAVYGGIFFLLLLNSVRQVRFSGAIALLQSENVGEKPPKGNWLFGLLGIAALTAAYSIALTMENPLGALAAFFVAVLLVIAGTYLLMLFGSVVFCRLLQRRKRYYYRTNHFVSVSSMVYRMKRNGAGLASICVLSTMVLVTVSSTACLYFGGTDVLNSRYPRDINLEFHMKGPGDLSEETIAGLRQQADEAAALMQAEPREAYACRCAYVSGLLEDGSVETDVTKLDSVDLNTISGICPFYFVPLEDYLAITGEKETLAPGEALMYTFRKDYKGNTLSFHQGNTFRIKKRGENFSGAISGTMISSVGGIMLVVPDLQEAIRGLDRLADYRGEPMVSMKWSYGFDTGLEPEKQIELNENLCRIFSDPAQYSGFSNVVCESREDKKEDFYGLFGGLFYLGTMLSIVFLSAAVLIIYYKQISEGYEDQQRFEIMQKVGMTGREIRKSINSQLLTVFFLPLLLAVCHLAFAFPIIRKILLMFQLDNVGLFLLTTAISVAAFALFYTAVYRITSNAYYQIVSGAREKKKKEA